MVPIAMEHEMMSTEEFWIKNTKSEGTWNLYSFEIVIYFVWQWHGQVGEGTLLVFVWLGEKN